MRKGDILTGRVESVDFPNKAHVRVIADTEDNGKTVIVKNSIPGQLVEFAINKKRGDRCEGRLLRVLEPSAVETVAPCRHFGRCGGCTYQTMGYDEQLSMKEKQVKDILDASIDGEYTFEGITGSPQVTAYRNKMEFSFGDEIKDGELTLGLHKRNSTFDIINVDGCLIVHDDCTKILECTLKHFQKAGLPYLHKLTHEGYLRHLLVRRAAKTGEILVCLVTTTQLEPKLDSWENELLEPRFDSRENELLEPKLDSRENEQLDSWKNELLELQLDGCIAGILHTYNDSLADVVKNDRTELLYGRDYITEELLGLHFKISAFSFFQTNSLGAEVLYSKARDYVGTTKDKTVFDLYSGTGTIAQILAPVAKKVIGVEIVEEAVEAARVNANLNGLDNCEFIADDVLSALDNIDELPDLIVLDPPRDGIHPKALTKIIDYGVDTIVYISCKPTSLARDLEAFQARGYRVEKACCVDMFPNTVHVETCALLTKPSVSAG